MDHLAFILEEPEASTGAGAAAAGAGTSSFFPRLVAEGTKFRPGLAVIAGESAAG